MWLAALDGSSPPRQFDSQEGVSARFGPGGDVFYVVHKGNSPGGLYRVKEDGSDLRKLIPQAYSLDALSPDGRYFAASVPDPHETGSGITDLYPVDGGTPVTICMCGNRGPDAPPPVAWSSDGKVFYISMVGGQAVFAIPLRPGQVIPPLPPNGVRSVEEAAKLPGAKQFPVAGAFPGPGPAVYAFPKFVAQRNIFRVPVP